MNRRTFLKLCGVATHGLAFGFGTTGCASFPKNVNWSEVPDKEFSLDKFDDWFVVHKLYNGLNPNLKIGQPGYSPTFKGSMNQGFTPGVDYSSNFMYAAAEGQIYKWGPDYHLRLGGAWLFIAHPTVERPIFITQYAHLSEIYKKETFTPVERGEKIASVMSFHHAKMMMVYYWTHLVDPDNYGENHSYMNYWDGKTNLEITDMNQRNNNQIAVVKEIQNFSSPKIKEDLKNRMMYNRQHRGDWEGKQVWWDEIERFRYLDALYNAKPNLFPELSPDKFAEYKREFYANQPIILTLPLKA